MAEASGSGGARQWSAGRAGQRRGADGGGRVGMRAVDATARMGAMARGRQTGGRRSWLFRPTWTPRCTRTRTRCSSPAPEASSSSSEHVFAVKELDAMTRRPGSAPGSGRPPWPASSSSTAATSSSTAHWLSPADAAHRSHPRTAAHRCRLASRARSLSLAALLSARRFASIAPPAAARSPLHRCAALSSARAAPSAMFSAACVPP